MDATTRPRRWIVAATLGIVVALGLPATDAIAGKGDKISAVVNGKKLHWRRKLICDGANTGGFAITGGQRPTHLGQVIRTIVVTCPGDVTMDTFPVSPPNCSVGYSEIRIRRGVPLQSWGGSGADVQVTLQAGPGPGGSFTGSKLEGTFSGTLQPQTGTGIPATVTKGSFSVILGGDGATCHF